MEQYLTANDVGREIGVTAQAVHQLARRGVLPVAGETASGIRLFRRADVARLAEERAATRDQERAREHLPASPAEVGSDG
jgi:DNA-binding transcriptional MerR regulator